MGHPKTWSMFSTLPLDCGPTPSSVWLEGTWPPRPSQTLPCSGEGRILQSAGGVPPTRSIFSTSLLVCGPPPPSVLLDGPWPPLPYQTLPCSVEEIYHQTIPTPSPGRKRTPPMWSIFSTSSPVCGPPLPSVLLETSWPPLPSSMWPCLGEEVLGPFPPTWSILQRRPSQTLPCSGEGGGPPTWWIFSTSPLDCGVMLPSVLLDVAWMLRPSQTMHCSGEGGICKHKVT